LRKRDKTWYLHSQWENYTQKQISAHKTHNEHNLLQCLSGRCFIWGD